MKPGDIVRVVKQRGRVGGVFIDVLNEVGWIEEIKEIDGAPWAQFNILRLDDGSGGCGGIPLSCLALEPGPEWKAAKDRYDARIEKLYQEGLERGKRWRAMVARMAEKHGVNPEVAENLYRDIQKEDYP